MDMEGICIKSNMLNGQLITLQRFPLQILKSFSVLKFSKCAFIIVSSLLVNMCLEITTHLLLHLRKIGKLFQIILKKSGVTPGPVSAALQPLFAKKEWGAVRICKHKFTVQICKPSFWSCPCKKIIGSTTNSKHGSGPRAQVKLFQALPVPGCLRGERLQWRQTEPTCPCAPVEKCEYRTHWGGYVTKQLDFHEMHPMNFMLDYIERDKLKSQVISC